MVELRLSRVHCDAWWECSETEIHTASLKFWCTDWLRFAVLPSDRVRCDADACSHPTPPPPPTPNHLPSLMSVPARRASESDAEWTRAGTLAHARPDSRCGPSAGALGNSQRVAWETRGGEYHEPDPTARRVWSYGKCGSGRRAVLLGDSDGQACRSPWTGCLARPLAGLWRRPPAETCPGRGCGHCKECC